MPKTDNVMPDEIKKKHYSTYMKRADNVIKDAYPLSKINSPSLEESMRNKILNFIATAMALAEIAEMDNPPMNWDLNAEKKEIEKKTEEIRNSENFLAAYGSMTVNQLNTMLDGLTSGEGGKEGNFEYKVLDLRYKVNRRMSDTREGRMGVLVQTLESSTQKSFFGKLKDIFVGNSNQYKLALAAMKELAEGKVKANDMQAKTDAILDYVLLRGGKVRDHEYGRDRFDAFLKGLGEIMEPKEFLECCKTLNERREQWYGNTSFSIHAENYVQTEEKRAALRKLQGPQTNHVLQFAKKQFLKDNLEDDLEDDVDEIPHDVNRVAQDMAEIAEDIEKVRESGDKTNKEMQAAEADYIRIEADQKAIETNTRDSHGNTFYERNQQYLDQLRLMTPERLEKMRNMPADHLKELNALQEQEKAKKKPEGYRPMTPKEKEELKEYEKVLGFVTNCNTRMREHPAFRIVAKQVMENHNLTKFFKVPETYLKRLETNAPEKYKELNDQVTMQSEMDKKKYQVEYQKMSQDLRNIQEGKQKNTGEPQTNKTGETQSKTEEPQTEKTGELKSKTEETQKTEPVMSLQ